MDDPTPTRISAALVAALALLLATAASASAAPTVVSMTFDDGRQTQYQALGPLRDHGMRATFYANSGEVPEEPGQWRMTWDLLHELAAAGNEIGGHSLNHPDLTTLDATELRRQVCDDRANLANQGFAPVSFSYPFVASNPAVEAMVKECGYTSARHMGGIKSPTSCFYCPNAESIPPAAPFHLRTVDLTDSLLTLATLQARVVQAERNGGGWVVMALHDICAGDAPCDPDSPSLSLATFEQFLDWLGPRAAGGTLVKTVREVMGQGTPDGGSADRKAPTTTIRCNGTACSGSYRGRVSLSLHATDAGSGVAVTRYTTDGSKPTATNGTVYSGPFDLTRTTEVKFRSWDLAGNAEKARSTRVKIS